MKKPAEPSRSPKNKVPKARVAEIHFSATGAMFLDPVAVRSSDKLLKCAVIPCAPPPKRKRL